MISGQIIHKSLEELHSITKVDFTVFETEGNVICTTCDPDPEIGETVRAFAVSPADSQDVRGSHFFKIYDEETLVYVLVTSGMGEDSHMMGKVAVSQIQNLLEAYEDRYDRNSFIQNLLLDNLLLVDIYNKARKLHIQAEANRLVYTIETKMEKDNTAMEIMRSLFGGDSRNFITAVDEKTIIFVQEMSSEDAYDEAEATANTICDMMNTEAMSNVRVAYGTIVREISQISRSYKEARMALDVGKIFYAPRRISSYTALGIGRLIYQLPVGLCEMFLNEVFAEGARPGSFDEETLSTIDKFFSNNLNVSETARQLYVHRNTLVYRLEKLEKSTGLDIRSFEDALTFKIAMMVENYMAYVQDNE